MLVLVKNPAISPKIALLTFSQRCRHFHDQSYMRKIHIIPKDSDLALNFAYGGGFIMLKQWLMQKTGILPLLKTGISQVNHLYHHHIQQQGHTNCEESITIYIYKDFFYWSTLKIMNITQIQPLSPGCGVYYHLLLDTVAAPKYQDMVKKAKLCCKTLPNFTLYGRLVFEVVLTRFILW